MEEAKKLFIRHQMLQFYEEEKTPVDTAKTINDYHNEAVTTTEECSMWFQRFEKDDFDLKDEKRSNNTAVDFQSQKIAFDNSETSLKDSTEMNENFPKKSYDNDCPLKRKWNQENEKMPRELFHARCSICLSLLSRYKQKESFLYRIVFGGEMWIEYDDPTKPSTSSCKRNHRHDDKLYVWWDMHGVLYFELVSQACIFSEQFTEQLKRLNEKLIEKRPYFGVEQNKVILLYNKAYHTSKTKKTLMDLQWEVLPYIQFADVDPTEFYLFPSMKKEVFDIMLYRTKEMMQVYIEEFISSKSEKFFNDGIHLLPERWQEVIDKKGKLLEK